MMIAGTHEIVRKLDALPYEMTLIGSRALGLHTERSDYDYLLLSPGSSKYSAEGTAVRTALEALGFKLQVDGACYGPDPAVDLYRWSDGKSPDVDLIVCRPEEYAMRLAGFQAMWNAGTPKAVGRLHRGLKAEQAWPTFWAAMRAIGGNHG